MSEITIEVEPRSLTGKNANRRLRAAGQIPAVVYGDQLDPVTIQVEERVVARLLRSAAGENTIFLLKLAGSDDSRHAMIRDLQSDSIRGDLIHIDFQRIRMSQKVHVAVPIELVGESVGVKTQSGVLDFSTRQIEIEVLPGDIPDHLAVDISELEIGEHISVGQVELAEGMTLLDDPDRTVVTVSAQRIADEVDETEEEEGLLEATAEQPERVGGDADAD